MKRISISLLIACVAIMLTAAPQVQAKNQRWLKERKELALLSCLSRNYKAIGTDISPHEWSAFHPRYAAITERRSPDYDLKYIDFMEKSIGSFYKEEVSVKAEGKSPPFTTIFAKCMEFSESKALREFLTKNPL